MGRHPSTRALVRRILGEIDLPTGLDADGILAYAGEPELLRDSAAGARLVITPHPGEFSALTGEDPEQVMSRRFELAAEWAERLGIEYDFEGKHYSEVIAEKIRLAISRDVIQAGEHNLTTTASLGLLVRRCRLFRRGLLWCCGCLGGDPIGHGGEVA